MKLLGNSIPLRFCVLDLRKIYLESLEFSGGPTYALDSEGRALAAGITKGDHQTGLGGPVSHYWCYVTITDALGVANYTLPTGK